MKVTLHNRPYYGSPEDIVRKLRERDHGQPRDVDTYIKRVANSLDFKVNGNSVADRCEDFLVSAIKIGLAQPVFHPEHLDSHAIRVLRKARGLSKEKLAHQLGVALMTINRWEDSSTAAEPKRFDIIQRVLFEQVSLSSLSTPDTSATSATSTVERPTMLRIRQQHRQLARWRPEPTRHRLGAL